MSPARPDLVTREVRPGASGTAGTVAEAWRYPVKSLGGIEVHALTLDARGVTGDRRFAVYGADGKIGSGKSTRRFRRMDGLLEFGATLDEAGALTLRTPEGALLLVPSPEADAALSAHLGETVQVRPEAATPHFDAGALHLITPAGLEWLAARLGGPVAAARFRPNLVIRTPGPPSPGVEDGWVGRHLRVGDALLEVTVPTERCVMVGLPQPGLASDERILRLLAREREACFGVYASVLEPGAIRLGAPVELLP